MSVRGASSRRFRTSPLAIIALVLASFVMTGCGSGAATDLGADAINSGTDDSASTEPSSTEPSSTEPSSTEPSSTGDAATTTTVDATPSCTRTTSPVASADRYSGSADTLAPLSGESIEMIEPPYIDDVALRFSFEQPIMSSGVIGDLDGDGLDEVQVISGEPGEPIYHLVPGATPPGEHDLEEVGIRLRVGVAMAPDRDGDDVQDLVEFAPDRAAVLSGAAVLDGDTGPPMFEVAGELRGFVPLGDGPPMLVTGELADGASGPVIIHLADEDKDLQFTTAPEPFVVNYTSAIATPRFQRTGDTTFLELAQVERSAARAYRWKVDLDCP